MAQIESSALVVESNREQRPSVLSVSYPIHYPFLFLISYQGNENVFTLV